MTCMHCKMAYATVLRSLTSRKIGRELFHPLYEKDTDIYNTEAFCRACWVKVSKNYEKQLF